MANRSRALGLVLAAAVVAGGCVSSTSRLSFAPREVQRLDGLRPGQKVELETTDGDRVDVTSGMTLRFAGPGGASQKVRCEQIEINGSLLSCVNRAGLEEHVDLARTPDAYVLIRKSSTSWTRVGLIVLGVYVVLALVAAAAR